jgi:MiaB-like tRNA modifying enzyme
MKIYIETYGCTANKSDESVIKGILLKNSFKIINDYEKADVIIILTCTVINTTEQKMISRFKLFKQYKKKIIVTGCMASVQSDLIKSILPDSIILPPFFIHYIIDAIKGKKSINYKKIDKTRFAKSFDGLIAPISISEGCNFSCSYCITTLARGKLRSFPIEEIENDVKSAINQGCIEIQLTSQDTSSYGLDSNTNLGVLLKNICRIKGLYKIRVGMMNPSNLLKNLEDIINGFNNNKIYKFLHLPVQSGDDELLKIMNRKYTINDFFYIISKFKNKFPDISISTDIIVGFPSETKDQFYSSINLIKKLRPDILNITKFSARPNTKAKYLPGRIKTEDVKNRSRVLTEIFNEISYNKNKSQLGKKYSINTTEIGKNNTTIGRTDNYKIVVIKDKISLGKNIMIEVISSEKNYIVGKVI